MNKRPSNLIDSSFVRVSKGHDPSSQDTKSQKGQSRRDKELSDLRYQESESRYQDMIGKKVDIASERIALRKIVITDGDRTIIGMKSSGWNEYKKKLSEKLRFLKSANIVNADDAARALNKMGFRTGFGQQWTPRSVKIVKSLLRTGEL